MRLFLAWFLFSIAVLAVSLVTGCRASRAAKAPQYLLTKTHVVIERSAVPADEQEAEILRRFAEAGEDTSVSELQPMFVLGLLDGALPLVAISGLLALYVARRRRRFARPPASGV